MDGKFKIFVIVAIAVLAIAIAGSTFFVMQMMSKNNSVEATQVQEVAPVLTEVELGDAILTNIASENSIQHYAKIQISIGIDANDSKLSDALTADIQAKSASVRSEVISALGEQTYTMLSNAATGKEKLADEIIARLNKILDTELIKAVYFKEYFVQ